jgi:chitin disaccharide deacetylase
LRAQIERALAWGIDVTHLAPHLTAITLRPEFFDVYLELAVEFASRSACRRRSRASRPASRSAVSPRRKGWSSPTTSTTTGAPAAPTGSSLRSTHWQPGVTEIHVQPAIDSPEVRALGEFTQGWIDDLALVTGDELRSAARRQRRHAHRVPAARRHARRRRPQDPLR